MSAKRILVISILALFCFSPMQGPLSSHLQADDGVLEASSVSLEILMMGNSYTSANSLDSIVDGSDECCIKLSQCHKFNRRRNAPFTTF
tara:strand:+ start:1122 stop:1388 length:267 start_codon:yes stop_codon:yes gene_type:complete